MVNKILILTIIGWSVIAVNGDVSSLPNTHLLCPSIRSGHENSRNKPETWLYRHCNFLLATPHRCNNFCEPINSAVCDQTIGACICDKTATTQKPTNCGVFTVDDYQNRDKPEILDRCIRDCKNAPTCPSGNSPAGAYATDVFNYICVCFCQ